MLDSSQPPSERSNPAVWVDVILVIASVAALMWLGPAAPRRGWVPGIREMLGAAVLLSGGHLLLALRRKVQFRGRRRAG